MSIIGIDIGTSGCKVCIFDLKGSVLSSAGRKYAERRGQGIREICPDQVRQSMFEALSEAVQSCTEPVQAISVTCLGESLVCLDKNDRVLYNSMVTGDNRGQEGVDEINRKFGSDHVFEVCGLIPNTLYSLAKLIWLRDHTDVLQKAEKIFFYEDYAGYLLTGERKVSYSTAARSTALDIRSLKWSKELLAIARLTPDYFSEPVPSGTIIGYVKKETAQMLGLSGNIPVVAGAHDQACAALGSGFVGYSLAEDCIGTCECLAFMMPQDYDQNVLKSLEMPRMIYPVDNSYFTTLEVTTCGALMNWARDTLFKGTKQECERRGIDFFRHMDERVTNRHTNILILPQFGSSGHPDLKHNMSASIAGLTLDTTEDDLYIALKESMLYQLKLACEYAAPLKLAFDKLVLTGGAANSLVSAHLRADIFQKPVYMLANNEAGTLGCMILAAVAIGAYPDIVTCIREVVKYSGEILPNPDRFSAYEEQYEKFKLFYNRMHFFPS